MWRSICGFWSVWSCLVRDLLWRASGSTWCPCRSSRSSLGGSYLAILWWRLASWLCSAGSSGPSFRAWRLKYTREDVTENSTYKSTLLKGKRNCANKLKTVHLQWKNTCKNIKTVQESFINRNTVGAYL